MSKPKGLNRIGKIAYLCVREIDPSFDNSPPTEILR